MHRLIGWTLCTWERDVHARLSDPGAPISPLNMPFINTIIKYIIKKHITYYKKKYVKKAGNTTKTTLILIRLRLIGSLITVCRGKEPITTEQCNNVCNNVTRYIRFWTQVFKFNFSTFCQCTRESPTDRFEWMRGFTCRVQIHTGGVWRMLRSSRCGSGTAGYLGIGTGRAGRTAAGALWRPRWQVIGDAH